MEPAIFLFGYGFGFGFYRFFLCYPASIMVFVCFFLPAMVPALAFLFDMAFVTLSFLLLFISLSILAMVLVLVSIISQAIVVDPVFGL